MIVIYIIAIVLFGLIAYLLFAPFYLEIDSNMGLYQVRFHRAVRISLKVDSTIFLELGVFGWTKKLDFDSQTREPKPVKKEKAKRTTKNKISIEQIRNVLKSFKITFCKISIDTGNVQWNALLYPLFYFLHWRSGREVEINFIGRNEIVLKVKNNIARMGWAFVSSK